MDISDKRSFALSIRDWDDTKNDVAIKHYRIRKMDAGGCYISPKRTFENIIELVEHYKSKYAKYMLVKKNRPRQVDFQFYIFWMEICNRRKETNN